MVGIEADVKPRSPEERFRFLFDSLPVPIWVIDLRPLREMLIELRSRGEVDIRSYVSSNPDFVVAARKSVVISEVNASCLRMLQLDRTSDFNARLSEFLLEEDGTFQDFIVAVDEKRPTFTTQNQLRATSGEMIPVMVAVNLPPAQDYDNTIVCHIDLRERVRFEGALARARDELDHALRAASMGQLTASIAHEVNQPISAVINYAKAAARWLDHEVPNVEEARPLIQGVIHAGQHASDVVKRVRKLLQKGDPEFHPVSLDVLVQEAIRHASRALPSTFRVSSELRTPGSRVHVDRVLIQQVVINLFTNAAQAVEQLPPDLRHLVVRTRLDGDIVVFEVQDNGSGFSDQMLKQGYGPFQTTKAQGMGLGLVISRATIEAHGGRLTLTNAREGGALASFTLPIVEQSTS